MIVFHSADMDGWLSAALVKRYLHPDGRLVYANYNQDKTAVEFILETKPEVLYIVDYSFEPDAFDKVVDACGKVYWYDHHQKKIDEVSDRIRALPGRRQGKGVSAAWLIMQDVKEDLDDDIVKLVTMASDYDVFNFDDDFPLECDPPKLNAYMCFNQRGAIDQVAKAKDMIRFAGMHGFSSAWLEDGETYLSDEIKRATIASKRGAFNTMGDKRFVHINSSGINASYVLKPHMKDVDFGFCWHMLKDGRIKLDLRSDKTTGCDVSKIAGYLGGGGHEHAAGCVVGLTTFLKLIEKR